MNGLSKRALQRGRAYEHWLRSVWECSAKDVEDGWIEFSFNVSNGLQI